MHNGADMPGPIDAALTKFHASLNVSDLSRSVAFYRVLLGVEPAKVRDDYAKFDLAEPPLVLSLIPGAPNGAGHLNHAGLRVRTAEELVEIQRRLEAAGMPTSREDGVECCYARQTKFWINDPDGALWEIYVFHEDIQQHGTAAPPPRVVLPVVQQAPTRQATHRLGEPMTGVFDGTADLDEVHLLGSLNGEGGREELVVAAYKALRSGGTVNFRGLAGDREAASVSLPGAAARVRYVPTPAMIVDTFRAAGFVDVTIAQLGQKPCFQADGVPLREIRLTARKAGVREASVGHTATYLGPMSQVADDYGNIFRRGVATRLTEHDWLALRRSSAASAFLFLEPDRQRVAASCCAEAAAG